MPQLLHFPLSHPTQPNLLCAEEQIYFLTPAEYNELTTSGKLEVLEKAAQLDKQEVRQMICTKGEKEIRLLNAERKVLYDLSFTSLAHYRKFIKQMAGMEQVKDGRVTNDG